ncbi:MAG: Rpn family recombination-promoting nuclease/putative transposase [Clostridiales Family XIII bacterium]|jgi:predicted transposase/invertase (TIGR01784 family)|nr:Rpn family recombination-promoting nuclease/putative transposase [Clostridiales Family XIII bacterium]
MGKLKHTFKSDILFKLTFVKHPHLLKRLVAAALEIPPGDIREFAVLNSEITPEVLGKKLCRLDMHMKVNGEYIDAEMQVDDEGNFAERLLVYWSKVFSGALDSGEDYAAVPRAVLISFVNFDMFGCGGYRSEFAAMERHRHEILTDKMNIVVFELGKLPEEVDRNNMLELFLRLFRADTEEEMENLKKLEVDEMTEMVDAYREIVDSPDYADLERRRVMARLDYGQALRHAAEVERTKWQGVVADKDAKWQTVVADKDATVAEQAAIIAELRARLGGDK